MTFVVPAFRSEQTLRPCLEAIRASTAGDAPIIVVFDFASPDELAIAESMGALAVDIARGDGPAPARNVGAELAGTEWVVFVDADVAIAPDAPDVIAAAFGRGAHAVVSTFETRPIDGSLTRLKNLQITWMHGRAAGTVPSFASALGAVRRADYLAVGGMDESLFYINDVEFGARLARSDRHIVFEPALRAFHLKHYTLRSWVASEVNGRAIPWTRLLLDGAVPLGTLNTAPDQALALAATVAGVAGTIRGPRRLRSVVATLAALSALNWGYLRVVARERSPRLTALAPLYLAGHYLCGTAGMAIAVGPYVRDRALGRALSRRRQASPRAAV